MRSFDIPEFYRSPIISRVKALRKPKTRESRTSLTDLDFGKVDAFGTALGLFWCGERH